MRYLAGLDMMRDMTFPSWGIRVYTVVFEFAVGYGYDDAISNRYGMEPCAEGDNVHIVQINIYYNVPNYILSPTFVL